MTMLLFESFVEPNGLAPVGTRHSAPARTWLKSLCGGELGDRRGPVLEVIDVHDLALLEGEDVDGHDREAAARGRLDTKERAGRGARCLTPDHEAAVIQSDDLLHLPGQIWDHLAEECDGVEHALRTRPSRRRGDRDDVRREELVVAVRRRGGG